MNPWSEYLAYGMGSIGVLAMLLAGLGLLRMPDLYTRLHVASKASTLGVLMLSATAAVRFGDSSVTWRVVALVVFVFLTVPVAAHMLAKASYRAGIKPADFTRPDQYAGHEYDDEKTPRV